MTRSGSTADPSGGVLLGRWLGRLVAVTAVVCFALATIGVHRGRAVQGSGRAIVGDLETANELFAQVDIGAADRVRRQVDELARVLADVRVTTARTLASIVATERLVDEIVTLAGDQLGMARSLQATAGTLTAQARTIADIASGQEPAARELVDLLQRAQQLLRSLNVELARTEQPLALLPEIGP